MEFTSSTGIMLIDEDSQDAQLYQNHKKRISKFIESSDESGIEDNNQSPQDPVSKDNSSTFVANSKDLNSAEQTLLKNSDFQALISDKEIMSSDADQSNLTNSVRKKKLKKRLIKLADSSDESDSDLDVHQDSGNCEDFKENDEEAAVEETSDLEKVNEQDSDSNDSSSDSSSDDDDAPPVRIFRNKEAAAMNSRGYDSGKDLSNSDSELASLPRMSRKPKRPAMPSNIEIKSETQRLIRESNINLPYHIPETKKLKDFLKRPIGLQDGKPNDNKVICSQPSMAESDVIASVHDPGSQKVTEEDGNSGTSLHRPDKKTIYTDDTDDRISNLTPVQSKKAKLLALKGICVPKLNTPNRPSTSLIPQLSAEFIDLDDDVPPESPNKEVSDFMQRFLKQSNAGKNYLKKKKVQFNIIKKENRPDGSGVELVSDVVTAVADEPSDEAVVSTGDGVENYKLLRQKLTAKMKQRRSKERIKKEEIYKLDNEEVGEQADDEEELDDEWSDVESEEEEVEEREGKIINKSKNRVIEDDEDEEFKDDSEPLDATQPVPAESNVSNASSASKLSSHTAKSDTMSSHISREGSMLLFDDSLKKSCHSREDLTSEDQTLDGSDVSLIPLNQPEVSDISESSKRSRLNFDDDSYFCSERSVNTNESQSQMDYESQFLDSDGFIKESKLSKTSLSSLLPLGGEDDNANDCNMSELLELCSGKFQDSSTSPQVSDVERVSDVDGALIDESFGFQVEPDTLKKTKTTSFSDADDSGKEEDEEGITIIRRKKDVTEKLMKNFLEEEAELSGDDVGSDDDDFDEEQDEYEEDENDEVLPKEEVIQQQVNKVHLKKLLDEDQRDIDLLQEAFIEEAVETKRNRKFRWKNIDENFTQDLFHSDDENESSLNGGKEQDLNDNEESQWRMLRLEREEFFNTKTGDGEVTDANDDSDSQLLRLGRTAIERSRVLSEVNEDSKGYKIPSLTRSNSLTAMKLPSKHSFLCRKPEILSKFANFKESKVIKGAVNSDRMVFKVVSPKKPQTRRQKRPSTQKIEMTKRLKMDEDSNSVFDLFDS